MRAVCRTSWPVNTPEWACEHFATIGDPVSLVYDVIGDRDVDDPDDCAGFLLERLWRLAFTYNPERDKRGPDFNGFANFRLRRFGVADYRRSTQGRTVWQFSTHTYRRKSPSSSVSTRRVTPRTTDWERLSLRGQAILRQIAIPHSEGILLNEIADELGISRSLASRLLRGWLTSLRC
jgi:hypothetical protein